MLPIKINTSQIKTLLGETDLYGDILHCTFDPDNKGGDATIGRAGNPVVEIFDPYSPDPQCLLCLSYKTSKFKDFTLTDESKNTQYIIFDPEGDSHFEPSQSSIMVLGIKTLVLPSGQNYMFATLYKV